MAAPKIPLYRTIAESLSRDIRTGSYTEGERLPASRVLARALGVPSRPDVT